MMRKMSLDDVRGTKETSKESLSRTASENQTDQERFEQQTPEAADPREQGDFPDGFQDFLNLHNLKSAWHSFRAEPKSDESLSKWLAKHQITELFHFSPMENLGGILNQGLVTILELKMSRTIFRANDHDRYDETGGICTSLGFPNYKLLYRAQLERSLEPVILRINPKALFTIPWIAVPTNAATKEMRGFLRQRARDLIGIEALTRMYVEEVAIPGNSPARRSSLGLPDSYPTDPQAEVIFLERIPPHLIMSLCVPDDDIALKVSEIVQREKRSLIIEKRPDLYKSRKDFQFWSGGKRIRLENQ